MSFRAPGGHNPWAEDDELPIRPAGGTRRHAVLVTLAVVGVLVGVTGGATATYLALRDDGGQPPPSSSSSTSSAPRTPPAAALDPSSNAPGAELTHLPVEAVDQARAESSVTSVTVTFVNRTTEPVRVNWVNARGELVRYETLEPGREYDQTTYATHPWLVTDAAGEPLVLVVAGDNPGTVTVGS